MALEAIAGIALTQGAECFIPGLLGQNGGRRDGRHPAIAPGHRALGVGKLGDPLIAIDKNQRGRAPKPRRPGRPSQRASGLRTWPPPVVST